VGYMAKRKSNGTFERCKAQLVVRGFDHKEGLVYHETFHLVVKLAIIHVILSLALTYN